MLNNLNQIKTKYLIAKKKNSDMETLNNQIKNKVLSENFYFDTETGNRILDYKSDYLMSDTDFKNYCQKIYNEAVKLNIKLPSPEYSFTWQTYPEFKKAEKNLLDWIRKNIVNKRPELTLEAIEKMIANCKYRERLINLTLQL